MSTKNNRETGAHYEEIAADYLTAHGYRIRERNYRNRYGEIDILAENASGTLIVCEVKYRTDGRYGDPLEAVDGRKQRRICRAALWYYKERGLFPDKPCRFDVIGICGDGTIRHIENAFEYRER